MATYNPCCNAHPSHRAAINVHHYLAPLRCWYAQQTLKRQVVREREELAALTLRQLRDIGVDPVDADNESKLGANQLPLNRQC